MHEGVFAGRDGQINEKIYRSTHKCKARLCQSMITQNRVNKLVPNVPGHAVLPGLGQIHWSKKKNLKNPTKQNPINFYFPFTNEEFYPLVINCNTNPI